MKKIFVSLLAGFALCACSYLEETVSKPCDLSVKLENLRATQTEVVVQPASDEAYYLFFVATVEDYQKLVVSYQGGELAFFNNFLAECKTTFESYVEEHYKKELGAHYLASFQNSYLYRGPVQITVSDLYPDAEYLVCSFCVAPSSNTVMGDIHKTSFHTPKLQTEPSRTELLYLVDDTGEDFYYYTKPMLDGTLSAEYYLTGIVAKEELMKDPYKGDLVAYATEKLNQLVEFSMLDAMMRQDISRERISSLDGELKEGDTYIIFGAPYNINNLNCLDTYTFEYHKGMRTDYDNDRP